MFNIRVLFIESDHRFIFGLPLGFRDLGHTILVSGAIDEASLHQIVQSFKPTLAVLMGWTDIHTERCLNFISETLHNHYIPCIYWATEDSTFTELFSVPLIKLLSPSYIFTVSFKTTPIYTALGYPASYLPFGFQPSIFKKSTQLSKLYNISLVANAYPNVLQYAPTHNRLKSLQLLLNPLLEEHQQVDIWGCNWDKMQSYLTYAIPYKWQHGLVHYLKTNQIYNCSNIILGLQNDDHDVITMRTYEILGSSGFLITSINTMLQEYFNPGKDFIMVSNEDEICEYTKYYLTHSIERTRIQESVHKHISQHTYATRAMEIINCLKQERILSSTNL